MSDRARRMVSTSAALSILGAILLGPTTASTAAPANMSTPAPIPHIAVVMMENRSYPDVIGNAAAPYTTSLASESTNLINMYAATHGSLGDYFDITAGATPGKSTCTNDYYPNQCPNGLPNIVDQLQTAGITWKAYVQNYPTPGHCDLTDSQIGQYDAWHVPFLYYTDINTSPDRCQNIVDLDQLSSDLTSGSIPDYLFVVPNTYEDMARSCTTAPCPAGAPNPVTQGDDFLQQLVPDLVQAGIEVVITWDEGNPTDVSGCCTYARGGHIPTVVAGPSMPPVQLSAQYDTFSLLAGIEQAYGLALLRRAGCSCTAIAPLTLWPTMTSPRPAKVFSLTTITGAWTQVAGADLYDVQIKNAPWHAGFSTPATSTQPGTSVAIPAKGGRTYCIRAAAVTVTGTDTSPYSNWACAAFPLPASSRAWRLHGFVRHHNATAYFGEVLKAKRRGAHCVLSGVAWNELAIVARLGPGYGSIRIYIDGHYKRTLNLAAATAHNAILLVAKSLKHTRTDTVVKIVSINNRPVYIEGLGVWATG